MWKYGYQIFVAGRGKSSAGEPLRASERGSEREVEESLCLASLLFRVWPGQESPTTDGRALIGSSVNGRTAHTQITNIQVN